MCVCVCVCVCMCVYMHMCASVCKCVYCVCVCVCVHVCKCVYCGRMCMCMCMCVCVCIKTRSCPYHTYNFTDMEVLANTQHMKNDTVSQLFQGSTLMVVGMFLIEVIYTITQHLT